MILLQHHQERSWRASELRLAHFINRPDKCSSEKYFHSTAETTQDLHLYFPPPLTPALARYGRSGVCSTPTTDDFDADLSCLMRGSKMVIKSIPYTNTILCCGVVEQMPSSYTSERRAQSHKYITLTILLFDFLALKFAAVAR